ncbi:blue copper protein 1a-like [Populus nigra]|uniref:blue copper protein 1a-like n=1 Tax=Populus nigra TaxID=3691 RepID=UPI002B26EAF8|nr:blue copper protein 1a-like [Populus nigra]
MASRRVLAIFVLIAAIFPMTTLATEYIVGDESGWTLGFDYHAWAASKNFLVGDELVFKYPVGAHNVFKVNGTEFQNCIIPLADKALTSGDDVGDSGTLCADWWYDTIVLASPGKKWYVCGVGKHCELGGQKLAITVQSLAPTPSPAPSPLYAKPDEAVKGKRPFFTLCWW